MQSRLRHVASGLLVESSFLHICIILLMVIVFVFVIHIVINF